jgi:hypothetical protein
LPPDAKTQNGAGVPAVDSEKPVLLRLRDVDVALELGHTHVEAELGIQVLDEAVQKMPRLLIAAVDQGIVAVDDGDVRVVLVERRQIRVEVPEVGAGRAHIGLELPRVTLVQVPDGRRQHHDVARRLEIPKNQLAHAQLGYRKSPR